jgi:ribosomal protein L16 Arg81 hydroxylase
MTLADVVQPLSLDEFLQTYVGRRMYMVRGAPGRFSKLISWRELGDGLSRMRVQDDRVSLVHKGRRLPKDNYVHTSPSGRTQYLVGSMLADRVLTGATLIVNHVDELFPEIRKLVESCEDTFQVYVAANLYAAWRTDHGFDTHWDPHDTLIVQVVGRKQWKVWRPTMLHPLDAIRSSVPAPSEDPFWQGELEQGDALYMPRGWWHVAQPTDEPSLHVTIGVTHPTGMDLLRHVFDAMTATLEMRQDIPHWAAADQRERWMQAIRKACCDALEGDIIEDYISGLIDRAHSRPIVRLPEKSAPPTVTPSSLLRLVRGRKLRLRRDATPPGLKFRAGQREWQCQDSVAPALNMLHLTKPCTLEDMWRATGDEVKAVVEMMVTAMVLANVVWIEPSYPFDDRAVRSELEQTGNTRL